MKRLFYTFLAAVALVGCSQFDDIDQPIQGGDDNTAGILPEEISAVVSDSDDADDDTRTYLVNDKDILWNAFDAINYFANTTKAKYLYNGASGVASAKFELVEETGNSRVLYTHAVYPYNAATGCTHINNVDHLSVIYPAEQTYAINSFGKGANLMVAAGTTPGEADTDLAFRNACGYFTIKLYSPYERAVKSIKLTALGGEKIAGPATIIFNGSGIPETTMSNEGVSEVTLNCGNSGVVLGADAENATEFWFALPPTTFDSGIRVEVVDTDNNVVVKETSKEIVVNRNKIQPMAAFKLKQSKPFDNQLWYTRHSSSKELMEFYGGDNSFDATITKHYYSEELKLFVVEFNAPLKVIKETAFKSYMLSDESKDIATIIIPQTVTTIEEDAFYASGITEFVVPGNVTYIGKNAFTMCGSLRTITFEPSPTNTPLQIEQAQSAGGADDIGPFGSEGYSQNSPLEYIYINRDFAHIKGGEPYTPDNAGEGIFSGIASESRNTTVVIGEQLKEIYPFMFNGCSIRTIEIPAHISKIGVGAFCKCTYLNSITIPATVKYVGTDAFYETTRLQSVIIEDSNEPLQLGNSYGGALGTIQRGAFYFSPLTNIYLGRDIDYRNYDEAFTPDTWDEGVFAPKHYDDETVETTVTIGNNVTTLSEYMFCRARMREVTIPASVKTIEDNVFYDCCILKKVTSKSTSPATLGYYVFDSCDVLEYIYVPSTAVSDYKDKWSSYKNYIVGY